MWDLQKKSFTGPRKATVLLREHWILSQVPGTFLWEGLVHIGEPHPCIREIHWDVFRCAWQLYPLTPTYDGYFAISLRARVTVGTQKGLTPPSLSCLSVCSTIFHWLFKSFFPNQFLVLAPMSLLLSIPIYFLQGIVRLPVNFHFQS